MFKRKKPKTEIDPKVQIEQTIENLDGFARKADIKRRTLLEKAKLAKARGDSMSYNMAVGALRVIMQQQKRAEQMMLSMQIMLDYRDVNALTSSFFDSMQNVCLSMGQLPDMKKVSKLTAEFNKSIESVNKQNMMLDQYMQVMSESMTDTNFEGVEADDDIAKLIDREISAELSVEDLQIATELADAKRNA